MNSLKSMSSRRLNRNTIRHDYSRKDFGCKSCEAYDCKGCDNQVADDSSSEGSDVDRWIATLSDLDENFDTPAADSGAETTHVEDRTLTQLVNPRPTLPIITD